MEKFLRKRRVIINSWKCLTGAPSFVMKLANQGNNSVVGVASIPIVGDVGDEIEDVVLVLFKLTHHLSYGIEYEGDILKRLDSLRDVCIHFPMFLDRRYVHVDRRERVANPFKKKDITTAVLYSEYLTDSECLQDVLERETVPIDIGLSAVLQTLCAASPRPIHTM